MAQVPKGGLVRGHDKRIHGSCAIYFPGGFLCWWLFGPCLFYGYTPLCSRVYYKLYPIIGNPYEKTLSQNARFSHGIQAQRVAELLKELAVTRLGVGNSLQPQGESPNHRRRLERDNQWWPLWGGQDGILSPGWETPIFFLATESFTLIGKLQKLERIACLERFQPFTFLFAVKVAQHGKCELFALGSVTQGRWCVSRRWWPCVNSACISSVGRKLGGWWSDLRSIFSRLGWWTNHQLDVILPTLGN